MIIKFTLTIGGKKQTKNLFQHQHDVDIGLNRS